MSRTIAFLVRILPFTALINIVINKSNLLINLLSLEIVMLSLVILVPISIMITERSNDSIRIILLTLGACEASLGLSLLVIISRSHGRDILNTLTSNKC